MHEPPVLVGANLYHSWMQLNFVAMQSFPVATLWTHLEYRIQSKYQSDHEVGLHN